jgi:DNA-binding XRE family transcriptional regulator
LIYQRIPVVRYFRNMSQATLAKKLGISRQTLWAIEGGMTPSEATEQKIREILGWGPAIDSALDALEKALKGEI